MLVCRLFYQILEPIQYEQVMVTDWNQSLLSRTLNARAEIGALVQDLVIDSRPDERAFNLAASISLESQSVSNWWPNLKVPSSCKTIFTRLQNASVIVPDISCAPLVEASIRVPSLKTFSIIPTHMDQRWPPITLGSSKMSITNLWIGSNYPTYQRNRFVRIGYAGFAYLPEVLQSIAKLEGFALLYPERWLERATGSPDIYLHDIVEALLSQATSLKTITIANNEEGKIQLHSELCDFRPFTKLIRLNILADTYSMQFWESLPPSLQQLQLEIYIEDLDQDLLADGIKQFAKSKVTCCPLFGCWLSGFDLEPMMTLYKITKSTNLRIWCDC